MNLTLSPIRLGPHIRRRSSHGKTRTPSVLSLDSFTMDDFGLFTPTLSSGLFEDIQCGPRTAAEWASVPFAMDADIAFDDHPRVLKSRAKLEPAKTPVLRVKSVSDPPAAKASTSALRESPEVAHEAPVPMSPLVSRKKRRLEDSRRGLAVPTLVAAPAKHFCGSSITPTDLDVLRGRGGSMNKHPGNVRFRQEVEKFKSLYRTSSHAEKNGLSWKLLGTVRDYGGRFLEKDDKGEWHETNENRARRKVSQGGIFNLSEFLRNPDGIVYVGGGKATKKEAAVMRIRDVASYNSY
ncbi:hypothetical protein THAOC_28863 [Thalassiosira oceanica]|uniref:DUF6824 domain-containing protein n=1 Tax=Thalassiosira oceanica TaxID=159749 RepID=K0RHZ6_THAOC|nr:hypothetical protein THAOC_28863 [Thalassiosira oceanica]|eukprot:EJK51919.1 hypothetical protein THAOC_28863 [Thalassiosira oceanica]